MHTHRFPLCTLLLVCILFQTASAVVALRVFSKDEGPIDIGLSRPRFYIQNFGTEPLSNFYCYYYFTTEQSKIPIPEDYYTPDATIALENLTNGNYRVRFNFTGVTINPGQTLPNPDGEVIGLHYGDYSAWDKTNDFSNTGLTTFTLNANIPVYSSSGTLIYGNLPSNPATPPQPPQVLTGIGDYAVLSKENTLISDRVVIKGGNVGSCGYVDIGSVAVINGSVFSGGRMFLRDRDTIKGDAVAGDTVMKQSNNSVVLGTTRSHAQLNIPQTATAPVLFGTKDTTVSVNGICDLQPGLYRNFNAFANAIITLHPGNYAFNKFNVEPGTRIIMKVSNIERLNLSVASELRFSDRTILSFEQGTAFPYSVKIYSAQTGQLFIGTDCQIYGNIICPDAEVHIYSRTHLNGAVYGKKIVIEPDAVVCKPPLLQDLWHSEWAYTPSFDPAVLDYRAVVTDATTTLTIGTIIPNGTIVTVDGQSPANPVNLTGTTTDIPILLNNPDQCGTTTYNLKVTKSNAFQIFVNDNSPCFAGGEDGNSWSTAYKDLQQAINRAIGEGKEIWVAEGTYKPTQRTQSTEPRSATFLVYSGIEIKGGFKGTEVEDNPEGSFYKTILSGDINGNDDSISVWPPSVSNKKYLFDNVYHIVTTSGNSKSIHLYGLVIQGGAANGSGDNRIGAGILNKNCSPTIEYCGIKNNYSDSSGAGIYDEGGFASIVNCLFKKNVSLSGNGSGLYVKSKKFIKIGASVFDGNATKDTTSVSGGGALYISGASTEIVNSIFTRNTANGKGGAIFNNGSILKLTNCTFYNNSAIKGAGGINNQLAKDTIVNTILWDNNGEISDTVSNVTYSCIKGGCPGNGNISSYPEFINADNPEGIDSTYGTNDDGLRLAANSPCLTIALASKAPPVDILGIIRSPGGGVEIGAYEYVDLNKCNKTFFGRMRDGVFYETNDIDRILQLVDPIEIYRYSKSRYHRVIRAYVEKNEYTNIKSIITAYIAPTDSMGNSLANEIEIKLIKTGEENGLLVFQSMTPQYNGKKIIFTGDPLWHGYVNSWAYVVYTNEKPRISYRVPRSQFK